MLSSGLKVVDSDASFLDVNYHKMKAERGESSIHKNRTDINLIVKPDAGLGAGASPNQAPPVDTSSSTAPPPLSIDVRHFALSVVRLILFVELAFTPFSVYSCSRPACRCEKIFSASGSLLTTSGRS